MMKIVFGDGSIRDYNPDGHSESEYSKWLMEQKALVVPDRVYSPMEYLVLMINADTVGSFECSIDEVSTAWKLSLEEAPKFVEADKFAVLVQFSGYQMLCEISERVAISLSSSTKEINAF